MGQKFSIGEVVHIKHYPIDRFNYRVKEFYAAGQKYGMIIYQANAYVLTHLDPKEGDCDFTRYEEELEPISTKQTYSPCCGK